MANHAGTTRPVWKRTTKSRVGSPAEPRSMARLTSCSTPSDEKRGEPSGFRGEAAAASDAALTNVVPAAREARRGLPPFADATRLAAALAAFIAALSMRSARSLMILSASTSAGVGAPAGSVAIFTFFAAAAAAAAPDPAAAVEVSPASDEFSESATAGGIDGRNSDALGVLALGVPNGTFGRARGL